MQQALSPPHTLTAPQQARRRDAWHLVGWLVALALLGASAWPLSPMLREAGVSPAQKLRLRESAAWEGRRLIAQYLTLKTHTVMHAGVEERAARPGEQLSRAAEIHNHGGEHEGEGAAAGAAPNGVNARRQEGGGHDHDSHDHGHEGASVQVIPPKREDFRGFIGDLERVTKPYFADAREAREKDADQTLPYYRLLTWADPHMIRGYTEGALFVSRFGKRADEGLQFLHEGEKYNPTSFEIQTELGHHYLVYKRDYASAERHLARAVALMPMQLEEWQVDYAVDAYRWRALNFREWGKPAEMRAAAAQGIRALEGDGVLQKLLSSP